MTSSFTPYVVADSPWSRVDARWKLAGLASAGIVIVFLRTLPCALSAFGLSCLLVGFGRIPWLGHARRAAAAALLVTLFAAWLPFLSPGPYVEIAHVQLSERGLVRASVVLAKALAIFTLMFVLWTTTPIETTLKAAHCLRLPGLVVQLLGLTYRYIFVLREETRRIRMALRVRGFRRGANLHSYRTLGHVMGSLLVRGVERAERVSQAMQCRGFDGQHRAITDFHTRPADLVFFFSVLVTASALLAWDLLS